MNRTDLVVRMGDFCGSVQKQVIRSGFVAIGSADMNRKLTMIYWKGEKFWLGKLLEHPEIMTQGETLEEMEANLRDAYLLMALDEVPDSYEIKEIVL